MQTEKFCAGCQQTKPIKSFHWKIPNKKKQSRFKITGAVLRRNVVALALN
jgi:hypothetical protein